MQKADVIKKFFDGGKLKDRIQSEFALYKHVTAAWVKLDSVLAEFWVGLNKDNFRNIRKHRVTKYKNSAAKGWDLNGETIQFATTAKLVNGQHRVNAVASGETKPIFVLVVFGVKDVLHIDTGMPRSLKDNFARMGYSNPGDLVGCVKRVFSFTETGSLRNDAHITVSDHADVVQFLKEHEDVQDSLPFGRHVSAYIPKNHAAALHYVFLNGSQGDEDTVLYYFQALAGCKMDEKKSKFNGRKDCPVVGLKDQLDKDNAKTKQKFNRSERLAMAIKAWNLLVGNEKTKRLSWRQATEDFPMPAGWEDAFVEVGGDEAEDKDAGAEQETAKA